MFTGCCGSRTSGLNSLVIVTENTASPLLWGTNRRRYRKTSTHPEEATYPCCIPALGELGDVPPRGGKDQCTPCPDRTAPQAARAAAQPAPQTSHEPHRPCHDPWSSQPHDQRHREIKRQNAASPCAPRVKEGGRVCLMRNRTRILCVCFKFGRLFL